MTKKDYVLIANTLSSLSKMTKGKATHEQYVIALANVLQSTNPRFNREKFIQACGVKL